MEIIVDDREKAVAPYLEQYSKKTTIDYKMQRIEVGDYAITYKGYILMIIERKTWEDLSASFRDGRKENVKKLIELRNRTGCQIAYLIEGNATPPLTKLYARLPVRNLRAHLDHLAIRDGIHMVYSKDADYTAMRIFELASNYLTLSEVLKEIDACEAETAIGTTREKTSKSANTSKSNIENTGNTNVKISTENAEDTSLIQIANTQPANTPNTPDIHPANTSTIHTANISTARPKEIDQLKNDMGVKKSINDQLLRCLPAIGSLTATTLAENEITVSKLYVGQYEISDIANIKYPSGSSIGLTKAKKIVEGTKKLIDSNSEASLKTKIKLLSVIPLISKNTAYIILQNISLSDILTGTVCLDDLANIRKTETIRLGNKAASNILTYFNQA